MPPLEQVERPAIEDIRAAVESFLKDAAQPALFEPGEELLPLTRDNLCLEVRGSRLTLQAWDRARNLTRRLTGICESARGRLELSVELFARREGRLYFVDLARPAGHDAGRRSSRLVFRERFRRFLRRQFPEWKLAEISTEADLEHSLSPAFPRAFLRHGQHGWAALACPPESDAGAALTFGLIWLAYLRAREPRLTVEALALYLPAGKERATALRLLCLDPDKARYELFCYGDRDEIWRVDPRDHGNLQTRLKPCHAEPDAWPPGWERIAGLPGVERVAKRDGRAALRVRGLEFAELSRGEARFGLAERRPAGEAQWADIERLVEELARVRNPAAALRDHPLYRQAPEAWLESQVRADLETIDASLLREPLYGQTPVFAGGERGVIDLLAADRSGRLAVLELKASADIHLPLQALDYWLHVKWHLDRGEFQGAGYFPSLELRREAPRLLLISPALEFHPATETLLYYFVPWIEMERIGLAVEWRKELRVLFRLRGAQCPQ